MIFVSTVSIPTPAGGHITCHQMLLTQRQLFVGTSTGLIVAYRRRIDSSGVEQVDSKPQVLEGHTGAVKQLIRGEAEGVGGDGCLLLSCSADRTVRVWDPTVRDPKKVCVQTLRGHGGTVTAMAFCENVLVTASTDRTVRLWRPDEGRELMLYPWFSEQQTLHDLDCWVNVMALQLGESGALYCGDERGDLSVYHADRPSASSYFSAETRVAGGHAAVTLSRWRRQARAHALGIGGLLLVPEERLLITSGYDHAVRLWDADSGASVMLIENEHKCRFTALRWNTGAEELFLGDDLGHVYVYSLATEKCVKKERLREPPYGTTDRLYTAVYDLSVANGEVIVSGATSSDAWLIVRDVQYTETTGHEGAVIALAVSDSGLGALANGGAGGGAPLRGGGSGGGGGGGGGSGSGGSDNSVVFSASLDNTIRAWDPYDMATLSILREATSEISCMCVSPLCEFLITGNDDGSIRLWNPDSGSTVTLEGHTNTVTCLDVAQRGNTELLLSSGFDGHVGVWDVTKRKQEMPRLEVLFRAHVAEVLCLKANPMNGTFITGGNGNDKHIHVWSLTSFAQLARLEGHAEAITCLALDGNFLLSGSEDGVVHVWDMHSYMALASLKLHELSIEGMLVVPENGLLVTCSTDSTVRVWDYGMGREVVVWRHPEEFRSVALRRSTGHILAGTEQAHIVAFPLSDVASALQRLREQDADEQRRLRAEDAGSSMHSAVSSATDATGSVFGAVLAADAKEQAAAAAPAPAS